MGKTDVRTVLGQNIKRERTKHGWTRAQLADLLGINSVSTVGNWEAGIAAPDCDKIYFLADLFGISTDALLGRKHSDNPSPEESADPSSEHASLLAKFDACDEIGQASIQNCVEFHYNRCITEHLSDRPEKGKNTTGIERLFLEEGKDANYEEMKAKLPYLRSLKKSKKKSLMNITEYLWDRGYGSEICLAFVMEIFGYGIVKRVPCPRLFRDIENYLKGNYKIYSE